MDQLSERSTSAAVILALVRQRCVATRSARTSRTGLQMRVPVQERPAIRRGIDALIEHGLLQMTGEQIGLSPRGELLLAHFERRRRGSLGSHNDPRQREVVDTALSAIEGEARLDAEHSVEVVRTLPGRLEEERRQGAAGSRRAPWALILLGLLVMAALAYYLVHR